MGGKDVVYVKQQYSSPLQPVDVQKRLKDVADKRFSEVSGQSSVHPEKVYGREMVCSVGLQLYIAVLFYESYFLCWWTVR